MSNQLMNEALLIAVVEKNKDGIYTLKVSAPNGTINEWTFGTDKHEAKGKVATILDAYQKGMEFVQEQVRNSFAQEEEARKA